MNIETLNWDPLLLHTFGIKSDILPEIRSSSEIYGKINCGSLIDGIPISGVCTVDFSCEEYVVTVLEYFRFWAINRLHLWVTTVSKKDKQRIPTEADASCCIILEHR